MVIVFLPVKQASLFTIIPPRSGLRLARRLADPAC
jgi:hypothetical protein